MPTRKPTKPKTPKRKTAPKRNPRKSKNGVDYEGSVLKDRELFLYGSVENKTVESLIKKIKALDKLNHNPIKLYINSGGGSVHAGLALIHTMRTVKSKIITVINSYACSMAACISIAGDERHIVENGFWMSHDMSGGIHGDYSGKVEARADFYIKRLWTVLSEHLKKYTELTTRDINQARNKELWLNAEECIDKGIADEILRYK